ncbi:hydroxymethylbutenyl pyrophosphate reductase [Stackebrandtia nassauensis DSM 44728]|uniref:4-hydroxy-3-methylbut-2-enyl diphosphate reductase n=1 Tax=Stackebrandtia nassauensis (strain DSM 44728 / CIP 108903 / NRRL B-16338 / NBRC 102104 / LLR-40K-21) TaxID=446470 RepID=D3Q7X1_STANL|nr:4-hydroxy-3-methylbut-2-enyl diphosphate reductase [Stackebrandtia nassauensis]ADD40476.1 hydroxymethylbutenyl pyrophosphate reductase [Stackebrandtia nassauensis DSM 44728]
MTTEARTVVLASPRSFCAGVERAIEIVELALERFGAPIYVRKQIVHNTHVVARLEGEGAIFVDDLDAVPDGACVVFSAHGVAPSVRAEAESRGLDVIDATCPLVAKVHTEARRFAERGDTILLIGHSGHEEVEGTMGEAAGIRLVESLADVDSLTVEDPSKVAYLTQTTLSVDETAEIIAALRRRFPKLRGPGGDDICYATSNRQEAIVEVAREADLVLVVGSRNSSNSRRLTEVAATAGTPAHLIEDAGQIRTEWLTGARVIGLSAGASAPPHLVEAVIAHLRGFGPVTVTERHTVEENVTFSLPLVVRQPLGVLLAPFLERLRLGVDELADGGTGQQLRQERRRTGQVEGQLDDRGAVRAGFGDVVGAQPQPAGIACLPGEGLALLHLGDGPDPVALLGLDHLGGVADPQTVLMGGFHGRHGRRPLRPVLQVGDRPPDQVDRRLDGESDVVKHGDSSRSSVITIIRPQSLGRFSGI